MKIRLTPWNTVALALLAVQVVLTLVNPHIYTDFHDNGLLHSIGVWATLFFLPWLGVFVCLILSLPGTLLSLLFSRKPITARGIHFFLIVIICGAVLFEALVLNISWKEHLAGFRPGESLQMLAFIWMLGGLGKPGGN